MAKKRLKERMREGLFLLDGAMGSLLLAQGIKAGRALAYANIDSAKTVYDIHKSYIDAGSDAVITNTFGANIFSLSRYELAGKVVEINKAGAKIARDAAGEDKYVLGDIGPSGDFLEPLGNIKLEELIAAYSKQAEALLIGGVDGFIIQTMSAADEISAAIQAVRSVCGRLPVFASMAFDKVSDGFRTSMGVDVSTAISAMIEAGADAVGFNCGTISLGDYEILAREYVAVARALKEDIAIYAEPNAGEPELDSGRAVYRILPEDFALTIEEIYSAGVHLIGGCCGTGPEHIKAIADLLRQRKKQT
jgi:5-methyltetrahydrofolate--homocysteine methyltransferase